MTDTKPIDTHQQMVAQLSLPVIESQSGRMQVVKSNKLIQAQYSLTATQQKLLSAIIAHVNPTEDYDKLAREVYSVPEGHSLSPALGCTFSKQQIRKIMTIGANNIGGTLLEASKAFRDMSVTYQEVSANGDVKFKTMNLMDEAEYDGETFKITFTPAASRELYNLRDLGYTKYLYENIDKMNNKYAIRLYELIQKIMHPKSKSSICKFEVIDLYYTLGLSDENGNPIIGHAKRYSDFKRKILIPAIKHINEKSNMELEIIEESRTSRKVSRVDIKATRLRSDIPELISDMMDLGVKEKTAIDWRVLYGEDRIIKNMAYMNNQVTAGTKIDNTAAYLKFLIEFDIANLPAQANPYSHLYSGDVAAQEFVKASIMPNWWEFEEDIQISIIKEGITGSIVGPSFSRFKQNYIENSVSEKLVQDIVDEISS